MITDVFIRPTRGEFDVTAIRAQVAKLPFTALDPVGGETYLVHCSDEALASALDDRRENPRWFPSSVILVTVTGPQISIAYRAADPGPIRGFVQGLREELDVRIFDDSDELTHRCDKDLTLLFGPVS